MKSRRSVWISYCRTIVDNEWLIVALLLPAAILPSPLSFGFLLVVPSLWLLRKIVYGHFVISTPIDLAVLFMLVMVLVSIGATFDITLSLPKLSGVVFGVAIFYATVAATSRSTKKLAAGVGLLITGGVIIAGLALLGMKWSNKYSYLSSIADALPNYTFFAAAPEGLNPNQIAGALLWIVPVLIAVVVIWIKYPGYPFRELIGWQSSLLIITGFAASLFLGIVFLLTQSRSGYVGFVAASILLTVGLLGLFKRTRVMKLSVIIVISCLLMATIFIWSSGMLRANFGPAETIETTASIKALQERNEIWSRALYGIEDFPITGMGIGTFRQTVNLLYPFFSATQQKDIGHAHNQFLQAALDLGVPGLVAFAAIWIGVGAMLLQTWRSTTSSKIRILDLGFSAALIGYFFYSIGDTIALGARPGFIFWLLIGLVAGMYRLTDRRKKAIP